VNAVDFFYASTRSWATTTLSQPRNGLAAATAGTVFLFAGGNMLTGPSDVVDLYDVSTSTWSAATLSLARQYLAGASTGGKALFGGGTRHVLCLDSWFPGPSRSF
jgi:hypothetical protein